MSWMGRDDRRNNNKKYYKFHTKSNNDEISVKLMILINATFDASSPQWKNKEFLFLVKVKERK